MRQAPGVVTRNEARDVMRITCGRHPVISEDGGMTHADLLLPITPSQEEGKR